MTTLTANGRKGARILGEDDALPFQSGVLEIHNDTDLNANALRIYPVRIPKGLCPKAQRVATKELPWVNPPMTSNPNGGMALS
jgi:hypothetical protein